MLAPTLATLPLACITLGNIAVTRTLSRIMQERGRRAGFTLGSLAGLIGGVLNVAAIAWGSFPLSWVARARSLPGVRPVLSARGHRQRGRRHERSGVSLVLAGSIVAAIVGKPVADWAKDLVPSLSFCCCSP